MKKNALLGAFALAGVIGVSACAGGDQVEIDETAPFEEAAPAPVEVVPDEVIVDSAPPVVDSVIVPDSATL